MAFTWYSRQQAFLAILQCKNIAFCNTSKSYNKLTTFHKMKSLLNVWFYSMYFIVTVFILCFLLNLIS